MNLWFDLKYAWRLLLKTPGHSLLCVVVVGLSVGLALWSYTLVYAMAFRPLPFPGTERWLSVQIAPRAASTPKPTLDAYTYQELLEHSRNAHHIGAFANRAAVLSEGQASTSLRAALISPALLTAMQVRPVMGRLFTADDGEPAAAATVVLSFDTWQNYFASDPSIVGKHVRIDAQPTQVLGVLPKDFFAFHDSELWLPLKQTNLARPSESTMIVSAFIVMDNPQNAEAALGEMKTAVDDVNQRYPERFNSERHVALIPANRMDTHDTVPIVSMMGFIAAAVLLLGCVNISMVFLARLLERSRELALRTAVGASRGRLLRQCLSETALVVVLGLLAGCGLAALGTNWVHSVADFGARVKAAGRPANIPDLRAVDLLVAVIAAAVLWLFSTLIPAWRVARQDAALVLAGSGKGVAGPGSARAASLLVGLQVTVSSLVLVICANLVLAIRAEGSRPTGLNTAQVMISTYPSVFDARYAAANDRLRYWDELTAAIKGRMAGAGVAYATAIPTRPASVPMSIEHQEGMSNQGTLTWPLTAVSDDYFALLGLELRAGRLFDSTDTNSSLNIAVVDENTVKRHWAGQNAIGKRIQLNPTENGPWLTVVGVVSDVTRPYVRDLGVVYRPLRQAAPAAFHLIVKSPTAATEIRRSLRAAAFAVDRDLPLHNLQTLDEYLAALNLSMLALVPAFSGITAITLIMAAAGLYGLISRSVAQRTQEMGVRRALGGTQWQVTSVFLRQGAMYMTIGVVGGALGIIVTNVIRTSIPNILNRVVPATLTVGVVLAVVIFTASYLPTRRAMALEPGDALRYE